MCSMFARSSGRRSARPRTSRRGSRSSSGLRGRAQAEREHVRVVPGARAARGLRVRAERRAHARDLVRRDRGAGARSSSRRRPGRPALRRRRAPRARRPRPSRRARRSASAPCGDRLVPAGSRSSSTTFARAACPCRSSDRRSSSRGQDITASRGSGNACADVPGEQRHRDPLGTHSRDAESPVAARAGSHARP